MRERHARKTSESRRQQLEGLPVLRRNVAGIDLGSEQHWVCAPTLDGNGRERASFGATTPELIGMAEWLKARPVEWVAMESPGVYWIAPHEVLEAQGLQLLLVDTRQLARVPGRDKKTDPTDCEWISAAAQLRITAGFVSTGGSPQLKPYVHSCVCRKQQHGSRKAIVHWRGFPKFSPRSESTNGQPGRACSEGWGKEMTGKHEIEGSQGSRRQLQGLPVIRRNVAGIDLGSERHWVCAPTVDGSGREIASYGATTPELIRLAEWLKQRQVESVAIAYASHCTSLGRCETFSINCSLFDNLTPL